MQDVVTASINRGPLGLRNLTHLTSRRAVIELSAALHEKKPLHWRLARNFSTHIPWYSKNSPSLRVESIQFPDLAKREEPALLNGARFQSLSTGKRTSCLWLSTLRVGVVEFKRRSISRRMLPQFFKFETC